MPKKLPKDPMQLAKAIGDIATATGVPPAPTQDELRRVMSALGKIGGPRGGKARAKALTPKKRVEIAKKAAKARWGKG
jgi:hypothetical protein